MSIVHNLFHLAALEIDNNYESANVAQVVAQYEIARLEWAKNNSIEFLMGFEMILYQEYPAKVRVVSFISC